MADAETTVAGAAANETGVRAALAAAEKPAKVAPEVVGRGARALWWRRVGTKRRGFRYEDARGRRLTEEAALARIKSLAVPPAWQHVRVAPGARCRVQAIGVDKLGRVQRIYDPQFVARRQREKFDKIVRFGEALPALRRKTNEDITREGLPRERVLAVVIRLINELHFRVGSEESVKKYRTYGVTTLRNRHLEIAPGGQLVFSFTGKHHVRHRRVLVDEELAALMGDIQRLRGSRLFHFYDEEQKRARTVSPRDVNEYIKAATSAEFSAKDFRTWGGTLRAAVELADLGVADDERQAKRNIVKAVKRVAEYLGNTPGVCRGSYIHPLVLQSYLRGVTLEEFRPRRERRIGRQQPEYLPEERALLKMLKAQSNGGGS
ncbi:MAG: DNA topoisomerase IB [Acidobacteria bacterium]|nr:DNA topoisomerase IB [Acidobacteriota bacterium]